MAPAKQVSAADLADIPAMQPTLRRALARWLAIDRRAPHPLGTEKHFPQVVDSP